MFIKDFDNNCVLVTLKTVSNLPDETIIEACKKRGWKPGHGITAAVKFLIAKDLGLEPEFVPHQNPDGTAKLIVKTRRRVNRWGFVETRQVTRRVSTINRTVAQFAAANPRGIYMLSASRHSFALKNGAVIDPNKPKPYARARIYAAIKVNNPTGTPRPPVAPTLNAGN